MMAWIKTYLIQIMAIVIAVLMIALVASVWWLNDTIDDRDATIATLRAEATLGEMQKEALRKAIIDQNNYLESLRVNEKKRADTFAKSAHANKEKYDKLKKEVSGMTGDIECEAMRSIIRGGVE